VVLEKSTNLIVKVKKNHELWRGEEDDVPHKSREPANLPGPRSGCQLARKQRKRSPSTPPSFAMFTNSPLQLSLLHSFTSSLFHFSLALCPLPFVIQITVSKNSPIFGVQSHETNQHGRFLFACESALFHQIPCRIPQMQTISFAGIN
jgi:hypothetical protein